MAVTNKPYQGDHIMKRLMAIGFALTLLAVVAAPSLYAQQADKQDSQSQQQSAWVCPHTGQPCPMGGQGRMHRGGRGMRGQGGNCPMAGQQCPYYTQNKAQSGSQNPVPAKADTQPAKQ
jgi:hypothetical protein